MRGPRTPRTRDDDRQSDAVRDTAGPEGAVGDHGRGAEAAAGRGAHPGGAARGDPLGLPSVRQRSADPRPPGAPLAASGHLPVPDHRARPRAAAEVSDARDQATAGAVGGGRFTVHGDVRGAGDRLAQAREHQGGGAADAAQLGGGRRHHAARGRARPGAAPTRSAASRGRGRDELPEAARVRHGGQRLGARHRGARR